MKCIICNSQAKFFFAKHFDLYNLGEVDYWKCQSCGFVLSKTHADMSDSDWKKLNSEYHSSFLGKVSNVDDPRWVDRLKMQAEVINDLAGIGILPKGKWLDFASGDGKLSTILQSDYGLTLLNYDRYMPLAKNFLKETELDSFNFVLTTSVFEHITNRPDYDYIASLVSEGGIMGLHTLVCEDVPCDPDWFYLLPVHCAFHTNKSMDILLKQWGFGASIYNVDSRLWMFFKSKVDDVETLIRKANERALPNLTYIFKTGFVDYWK